MRIVRSYIFKDGLGMFRATPAFLDRAQVFHKMCKDKPVASQEPDAVVANGVQQQTLANRLARLGRNGNLLYMIPSDKDDHISDMV